MKKVLDKVEKLFYNSILGTWYVQFILWRDYRKLRKSPINIDSTSKIVINNSQSYYTEGLKSIKMKINSMVKVPSEYDKILEQIEELLKFADNSKLGGEKEAAEVLKSIHVKYGGKDIKSEEEKSSMINERIQNYYELQRHKVKRDYIRRIRKAKNAGNTKLVSKLEKEFNEKFRRS